MNIRTNNCPCCGCSVLRHIRHGSLYWFCQNCWQEVPLLNTVSVDAKARTKSVEHPPL